MKLTVVHKSSMFHVILAAAAGCLPSCIQAAVVLDQRALSSTPLPLSQPSKESPGDVQVLWIRTTPVLASVADPKLPRYTSYLDQGRLSDPVAPTVRSRLPRLTSSQLVPCRHSEQTSACLQQRQPF